MSRGYRILILAIGLALVGANQPPKPSAHPPKELTQTAKGQPSPVAFAKDPATPPKDAGCQRGEENRQSDLCAQWRSADAAADSARWSLWMVWLSGFGLLIGGGTLLAAWRAAHWAKAAAEHTQAAANIADKLGRAQLAAYFNLVNVEYTLPKRGNDILLTIQLLNNGITPAKNYRHDWDYKIAEPEMDFIQIPDSNFNNIKTVTLGPSTYMNFVNRKCHASREEIDDIRLGRKWFYIFFRLEYVDINGVHHRIDFGRHSKRDVSEGSKIIDQKRYFYTSTWCWIESHYDSDGKLIVTSDHFNQSTNGMALQT